jgi:hypothetical protein
MVIGKSRLDEGESVLEIAEGTGSWPHSAQQLGKLFKNIVTSLLM